MKSKGAVACGHAGTADAALAVLGAGGNAVDASIAAFFAACVYEPILAAVGGAGFAMCRMGRDDPAVLDFFAQTPSSKRPADELDFESVLVDFGGATQEFHIGFGSIAVPGAVKGVFELHRRYGSVPMTELVQPALDAVRARPGVCDLQAHIFEVVEPIYIGRRSARELFESPSVPGRVLQAGDPLRFDAMGEFLDTLGREGEDLFYRGEVASAIGEQCRTHGGSLTRMDMERYTAQWREPVGMNYRDSRVWLNPPPSAGGALIVFALKLLDRIPALTADDESYRVLADVMALTNDARLETTARERPWPELEKLLGEAFVNSHVDQLTRRARAWRGTTHISVVDAHDGMVGMTVTNGEGCGEITPHTGIMFNNMLGEEDLNPTGFHHWPADSRMSSMMAPTLLERPGEYRAMLGSGGSNRIRTAILQVIVQLIDRGRDIEAATLFPRIHLEGDLLNIEGGIDNATVDELVGRFPRSNRFGGYSIFFGGVHSVMSRGGVFEGAGDPRRAGVFTRC